MEKQALEEIYKKKSTRRVSIYHIIYTLCLLSALYLTWPTPLTGLIYTLGFVAAIEIGKVILPYFVGFLTSIKNAIMGQHKKYDQLDKKADVLHERLEEAIHVQKKAEALVTESKESVKKIKSTHSESQEKLDLTKTSIKSAIKSNHDAEKSTQKILAHQATTSEKLSDALSATQDSKKSISETTEQATKVKNDAFDKLYILNTKASKHLDDLIEKLEKRNIKSIR